MVCGNRPGTPTGGVDALDFTYLNVWVDRRGQSRFTTTWGGPSGVYDVAGCGHNSGDIHDYQTSYDARGQILQQQVDARVEKYRYDASGNRSLLRRQDSGWYQDVFAFPAGSNRVSGLTRSRSGTLAYSTEQPQINSATYTYDLSGARATERVVCRTSGTCAPSGTADLGWRDYKYDGLGRTVATNEWVNVTGGTWQKTNPASPQCAYDAVGRMWAPCENGSPSLTFDGNNIVHTWGASSTAFGMSFVHGPGLDDALFGMVPNYGYRYIWVTDGQGRQYANANYSGSPVDIAYNEGQQYENNGGKYSGGNTNSGTFSSSRQPSAAMLNMSSFRNRFYDQQTGRWTQEDPMGVAGGSNLYGFNGNNPAGFSDPFGLCKDKDGRVRPCTVKWSPEATDTTITDSTKAKIQQLADSADVDLVLSSGRRSGVCRSSLHNCGRAVDIKSINGVDVGQGTDANPDAASLVNLVQGTAMRLSGIKENFGPMGVWKQFTRGTTSLYGWSGGGASYFPGPSSAYLWNTHQNHIHIGVW